MTPFLKANVACILIGLAPIPTAAQTNAPAPLPVVQQETIAQIAQDMPLVHALMVTTGRYEMITAQSALWIDYADRYFGAYPRDLWEDQVAEAFAAEHLFLAFAQRAATVEISPQTVAYVEAFYTSDLGQRITAAEAMIQAERLGDADLFDAALAEYAAIEGTDDPRVALIAQMIETHDLVNRILMREADREFAELRGLRSVGYFLDDLSDEELRERVTYDPDARREAEQNFQNVFGMMMHQVFTPAEMADYIANGATQMGQQMSASMHAGNSGLLEAHRFEVGRIIAPIWIAEFDAQEAAAAGQPEAQTETE